jgi:hypothetical protein
MFACIYSKSIPGRRVFAGICLSFRRWWKRLAEDTAVLDVEGCELLFGSPMNW